MAGFIVDTMLGTLAKWLRVLGFDTLYEAGMEDNEILRIAESQDRIIISRDRELCGRKGDSLYVESTDLDTQIKQVMDFYSPNKNKILSRCLECNTLLENVPQEELPRASVPEGIWERYPEYWYCRECDAYYWPGSHYDNMKKQAMGYLRAG